MKLGPLLLLSLLVHAVLFFALRSAPGAHAPAPPVPPLVWLHLAAPAPPEALPAPPAPAPAEPAAPALAPAAPAPAVPARAPAPALASARLPSALPARRARSAPPVSAVSAPADPGIDLPVETEAGALTSPPSAGARVIPGPGATVPALPGPLQAGAPPSAPSARPFDVRAYADSIRRRIDAEKQYPARARRLGLQGVVTVLVAVDGRGRLVRPPRLAHTSGVAALDHEALRMVQAAAPFTPPAGAASPTAPVEVQVPVRFSLADPP